MTTETTTKQALGPNQERWLAELESGKWSQCTGVLCNGSGHCCLGVACELFATDGKTTRNIGTGFQWFNSVQYAPEQVEEAIGLYDRNGDSEPDSNALPLVVMNDNGKTFADIAAIVRADPSVYFREPK